MDYRLRQDIEARLQHEIGTIYKPAQGKVRIALAYPNTYYVGMSNLGFQTVYGVLNERDDVCCERVFLPDPELIELYSQTHTALCSLETQTALSEFDIVAFSVSFENDYLNLLKILALAKIPFKSSDRGENDPVIILGGAITTINPEPLALFVDVCVLGDGENILPPLLDAYKAHQATGSKAERLEKLAHLPGVYVPSLYDITYDRHGHVTQITAPANLPATLEKCPLERLDESPAYSRILTEDTEFGDMFLIQINRGCPYKCRFCHTGYTQTPLRHLSLETAIRLARQGLQVRDRIGLVGAAIADYPHLKTLCRTIVAEGGRISVSSLRLSALAHTDYLLQSMVQAGQKTVTLAPEAGTERLRNVIRKPLSDAVFYETVEYVIAQDIPNLKFYFLIGLPTETHEDLDAIIQLCATCKQLLLATARSRGSIGKMTISVNPFIPKPFTPLQWCSMEREAELKRKIQHIKRGLQRLGNVEVIHEGPKWALWQGILARGDRRLADVLIRALEYRGNWKKAFRACGLSPEFYAHRPRKANEYFPWNHLHVGFSGDQLRHEYERLFSLESQ